MENLDLLSMYKGSYAIEILYFLGTLSGTCEGENETPAYVQGTCPYNMFLVTRRRCEIKRKDSECFKEKKVYLLGRGLCY